MKRNIKILSIFLFILGIFSLLFLFESNKSVGAVNLYSGYSCVGSACNSNNQVTAITADQTYKDSANTKNTITILKNGNIEVTYQYAYTELLILVEKCTTDEETREKYGCSEFTYDKVYQYSGSVNISGKEIATKTINLSNVYASGDIIRISIISEFINTPLKKYDGGSEYEYKDAYFPQFCTVNLNLENCSSATRKGTNKNNLLPKVRTKKFMSDLDISISGEINDNDAKIIYKGSASKEYSCTNSSCDMSGTYNKKFIFANVVVDVEPSGEEEQVTNFVKETLIPILLAVIGVAAVVSGTVLGYKIVKNADDTGERANNIKSLRNILIGLGATALILLAYEPVYKFMKNLINSRR